MRLLLILLLILQLPLGVLAQGGNLQFNRVLNFTSGANYTVPQGKVLKIESYKSDVSFQANYVYYGCDTSSNLGPSTICKYVLNNGNTHPIKIGNFVIAGSGNFNSFDGHHYINVNSASNCGSCPVSTTVVHLISNIHEIPCPFWLPAGEVITIFPYNIYQHNTGLGIHISAIEFNIVP